MENKTLLRVCSEMLEALQDKELRAQQRLDRCAEERGRRMAEQRRKEQKRRAAAEEKRRQQQEAEKVRGHRQTDDAHLRMYENTFLQLCSIFKLNNIDCFHP